MNVKQQLRVILETSRLNQSEKIVCISILANGKTSIGDMHNFLGMSWNMLKKICDNLVEYGYIQIDHKFIKGKRKDIWALTDKIFQDAESVDKVYYKQIALDD